MYNVFGLRDRDYSNIIVEGTKFILVTHDEIYLQVIGMHLWKQGVKYFFCSINNNCDTGYESNKECVCVCCVFSSHSFWTSMDVPAGVTQEEGHTGIFIHLLSAVRAFIFLARRIQPFLSLVDREVEFCVLTI